GLARVLLAEEVPARHGTAGDLLGHRTPHLERPALVLVPGAQRSRFAPQCQHRARDPAAGATIGGVVLAVDAGGSTVLLADRVHVLGAAQLGQVRLADL